MTEAPVFIIGVPRSGTTLLATLLEGHPELYVDDEAVALRFLHLRTRLNTQSLPAAVRDEVMKDRRLERFYRHLPEGDGPVGPALVSLLSTVAAGRTYVDKSPDALPRAEQLAGLFPGSRFLHVVRDPRPTVASLRRRQYLELTEAALRWRDWTDHALGLSHWWAAGTLHRIRYENLVTDPAGTLRKACEFLDIGFDPAMLDLAASSATGGANAYVKSTVDDSALDGWRSELTPAEAGLIEDICRPGMGALGYPLDRPTAPVVRPGYWTVYRRQVAHKFRLLWQAERTHMSGRKLHRRRVPLTVRLGALLKAILRGLVREEALGKPKNSAVE